jgi:hypothetical protein
MLGRLRRGSPSGVIVVLALVGAIVAAAGFVITSTGKVKPSVQSKPSVLDRRGSLPGATVRAAGATGRTKVTSYARRASLPAHAGRDFQLLRIPDVVRISARACQSPGIVLENLVPGDASEVRYEADGESVEENEGLGWTRTGFDMHGSRRHHIAVSADAGAASFLAEIIVFETAGKGACAYTVTAQVYRR